MTPYDIALANPPALDREFAAQLEETCDSCGLPTTDEPAAFCKTPSHHELELDPDDAADHARDRDLDLDDDERYRHLG